MRSAFFALTGGVLFAYWALGKPSFAASPSQSEWPTVLWFSASLALLALALAMFGRLAGGGWAARLALVASGAVACSSLANILEDGLDLDWAFAVFILGELVALISLVALTVVLAATSRGTGRMLAVVPAGTALGLILFVYAGGLIMLVTWLAAAARLGVRSDGSRAATGASASLDEPA